MPKLDQGDLELQTFSEMHISPVWVNIGDLSRRLLGRILCEETLSATPHHFRMELTSGISPKQGTGARTIWTVQPTRASHQETTLPRGGLDWIKVFLLCIRNTCTSGIPMR